MKLLTQLFLVSLILVKIVLGTVFIYRAELNPLKDAMASDEVQKEPEAMESLLIYLESLVLARLPGCGNKEKRRNLVQGPCANCHAGEGGRAQAACSIAVPIFSSAPMSSGA